MAHAIWTVKTPRSRVVVMASGEEGVVSALFDDIAVVRFDNDELLMVPIADLELVSVPAGNEKSHR
jgi:hypothetical protein